jgi:hypothetical protein
MEQVSKEVVSGVRCPVAGAGVEVFACLGGTALNVMEG